jgi:hypothetical protein
MTRKTQRSREDAEFIADMFAERMVEVADRAKTAAEVARAERHIERLKAAAARTAPWKYGDGRH